MLLYFRSIRHFGITESWVDTDYRKWIDLISVGNDLENETFGDFGFERNVEFLKIKRGQFAETWRRAAEKASPGSEREQRQITMALWEMWVWLVGQFAEIESYKVSLSLSISPASRQSQRGAVTDR
jgi:hypothetical protein